MPHGLWLSTAFRNYADVLIWTSHRDTETQRARQRCPAGRPAMQADAQGRIGRDTNRREFGPAGVSYDPGSAAASRRPPDSFARSALGALRALRSIPAGVELGRGPLYCAAESVLRGAASR